MARNLQLVAFLFMLACRSSAKRVELDVDHLSQSNLLFSEIQQHGALSMTDASHNASQISNENKPARKPGTPKPCSPQDVKLAEYDLQQQLATLQAQEQQKKEVDEQVNKHRTVTSEKQKQVEQLKTQLRAAEQQLASLQQQEPTLQAKQREQDDALNSHREKEKKLQKALFESRLCEAALRRKKTTRCCCIEVPPKKKGDKSAVFAVDVNLKFAVGGSGKYKGTPESQSCPKIGLHMIGQTPADMCGCTTKPGSMQGLGLASWIAPNKCDDSPANSQYKGIQSHSMDKMSSQEAKLACYKFCNEPRMNSMFAVTQACAA